MHTEYKHNDAENGAPQMNILHFNPDTRCLYPSLTWRPPQAAGGARRPPAPGGSPGPPPAGDHHPRRCCTRRHRHRHRHRHRRRLIGRGRGKTRRGSPGTPRRRSARSGGCTRWLPVFSFRCGRGRFFFFHPSHQTALCPKNMIHGRRAGPVVTKTGHTRRRKEKTKQHYVKI